MKTDPDTVRTCRDVADTLRLAPCLQELNGTALHTLRETARQRCLARGAILFREGSPCEQIFIVISGKVNVYRLSAGGRQQTLWTLTAGDCFCLAPFFQRSHYPGTAQCVTEARVLEVAKASLLTLPQMCPGLAEAVVTCLCHRVATTAALLEDVATQHVRHRLARLLLSLGESRNIKTPLGGLLIDGWTHEELASCVGTVREVASRTLKQFEREGLIRLGRRHLVLLDPIRLKADIPPGPPPSVPQ